ncbi:UvrD-helicase domain-containing protein [Kangiella koreensis]|uniref:DNA 3'-5' helicase n=1 Tax=Kangiella koreensis (strain DSM 16069 / JCM 12317 / KCTC 12182 / SW-125) TaxID=523791 RepID=C7RA35_KANKD|nr:UvrD-helicase domain-containing protein [Kangiella koreensis]ACV26154.1 UvrD/REP helicase [Kangiella koreensis DSM 16069]
MIQDLKARQEAIDHTRSFIVQAPAGSGKTELLTQRVLKLLAVVQNPEEVVAITFTNKAAREMQNRIMQSLYSAQGPKPDQPHKVLTWELAKSVLQRDQELDWGLMHSPHRLRIKTFDSLCATIANQMPVLAKFGGQLSPTENPYELYYQAAKSVVDGVKTQEAWAGHVHRVLAHTDNKVEQLQELLAQQLAKRDQWLRLEQEGTAERDILEQGFIDVFEAELKQVDSSIPQPLKHRLLSCIIFAANYFEDNHPLFALKTLVEWPEAKAGHLVYWQAIANFCMSKNKAELLKTGPMPPQKLGETKDEKAIIKLKKDEAAEVMAELAEYSAFVEHMAIVRNFPNIHYQDDEWEVIESLTELMRIATAHLTIEFKRQGVVDFTEISMAADRALGNIDAPSELALKLDYGISHILVDEFQDTSYGQYQLIEKLTAGWQADDGRTLFVVGDPMQSIYRFREANVGLFIQARDHGIGDIRLEFLQLTSNFRSSETVVNWVNKSFANIFPSYDDAVLGAVSLAEATATKDSSDEDKVDFKIFFGDDSNSPGSDYDSEETITDAATQEANYIAEQIEVLLKEQPEQDIAVLVRARNHGVAIIEALQQRAIAYVAEEFEELAEKQSVLDVLTLLRVLIHPHDKVAWMALLKSPWFGLTLTDMSLIESVFGDEVYRVLTDYPAVDGLSLQAVSALEKQGAILEKHRWQLYQQPLAIQLEALWLHLGGALSCQPGEIEQVYTFLDFVSGYEQNQIITDYNPLLLAMSKLHAPPSREDHCRVSIMTMHKSKGLEFDTVFLPQLNKGSGNNDKQLMVWEEFPAQDDSSQYLMAPVDQVGESNSLYKFVNDFSRQKNRLESGRLLYVASTRAKRRLFLTCCGAVSYNQKEERLKVGSFGHDSLMNLLRPIYETFIESEVLRLELNEEADHSSEQILDHSWQRLKADWSYPKLSDSFKGIKSLLEKNSIIAEQATIEFDWATDVAKTIGVLMHRQLELISKGLWQLNQQSIRDYAAAMYEQLLSSGYNEKNARYAQQRIEQGLTNVLNDPKAQWILSAQHQDSACELALTGVVDGEYKAFVIDRTFVDEEGTRWIVDYKTGSHLGDDIAGFIQSEKERYQAQLEQYKTLMAQIDQRPIKLALYFPMMKRFEEL